jgi:hypothetical protein
VSRPDLARRGLAEGLAAFALVFAGCGAIVAEAAAPNARVSVATAMITNIRKALSTAS